MMPGPRYKKCAVCYVIKEDSSTFLAKFPLDVARCREWVQAVGQEDLLYIPVRKLHQLKYVCGRHFRPQDFNPNGNRLLKSAVPTQHMDLPPLPDEMLKDFPLEEQTTVRKIQKLEWDCNEYSTYDSSQSENIMPRNRPFSWFVNEVIPITDNEEGEENSPENVSHQWMDDDEISITKSDKEPEDCHYGFQCNECNSDIIGFRYACVQCEDYDLCAACEAARAHATHAVLRLPGPGVAAEVESLLERIRKEVNRMDVPTAADVINIANMALRIKAEPNNPEEIDRDIERLEESIERYLDEQHQFDTDDSSKSNTSISNSSIEDTAQDQSMDGPVEHEFEFIAEPVTEVAEEKERGAFSAIFDNLDPVGVKQENDLSLAGLLNARSRVPDVTVMAQNLNMDVSLFQTVHHQLKPLADFNVDDDEAYIINVAPAEKINDNPQIPLLTQKIKDNTQKPLTVENKQDNPPKTLDVTTSTINLPQQTPRVYAHYYSGRRKILVTDIIKQFKEGAFQKAPAQKPKAKAVNVPNLKLPKKRPPMKKSKRQIERDIDKFLESVTSFLKATPKEPVDSNVKKGPKHKKSIANRSLVEDSDGPTNTNICKMVFDGEQIIELT